MTLISITLLLIVVAGEQVFAATKTWVGPSTGGDWNVVSYWNPTGVPTSSDDVTINGSGGGTITITISSTAQCGSLVMGGSKEMVIQILTGASLTINGTTGNLSINSSNSNKPFTLAVGAGSLIVAGLVSVSTLGTNSLTVSSGSVSFSNPAGITWSLGILSATGPAAVNFTGNFIQTGGTIQNITSPATFSFNGNFTYNAGTWSLLTTANVYFGGNFTFNGGGGGMPNSFFTGTGAIQSSGAISFANLQINTGAVTTLNYDVSVNGNLTVNGTYNLQTYTSNRSAVGGGSFVMGANSYMKLAGNTGNFPLNFSAVTMDSTSTVEYNGINQAVYAAPVYYGNLILTGAGFVKTAGGNILTRNILINNATTFSASAFSHTISRNWTNSGFFQPGGSTVTFNYGGIGTQEITKTTATADTFNNLVIASSGSNVNLNCDLIINGNMMLNAGVLNSGNQSITIKGSDWSNNGGTFNSAGTVTFECICSQQIAGTATSQSFYNVVINSDNVFVSGSTNVLSLNNLGINTNFSAPALLYISGNLSNGTNSFNAGAFIGIAGNWSNNGTFINNSGTVEFYGYTGQTISGSSTTVFNNLTINNSGATGITLAQLAEVNGTLTLTDGVINTDAANLLVLNNGSSSSPGSAISFVDGPIKKRGTSAFTFSIGDQNRWRPLAISPPATDSDFIAQYNATAYPNISSVGIPINDVSRIEYWNLSRTAGTAEVNLTLYWQNASESGIDNCADLRMARWNGVEWENTDATPAGSCDGTNSGSITTSSAVSGFGEFTFASLTTTDNPLDYPFYWVGGNGSWNEYMTHWATSSAGTEFHSNFPTINDDVFIDENSGTVTITMPAGQYYCRNFMMSGSGARSSITGEGSLISRP